MEPPPFEKHELKEGLPLAATPSPYSTPSSNPDAVKKKAATKLFEIPSTEEIDELRLGFATPVTAPLAEMKSAVAPPPSAPSAQSFASTAASTAFSPASSSAVRGTSPYFAANNAPVAANKKKPLLINVNQRPNHSLIRQLKNVQFEFVSDIGPDFIFTPSACGFFLSMRFHLLNKPYIAGRVHDVRNYPLRIVLCLVDVEDAAVTIRELSQHCLGLNVTLILAWSHKEAARYLETFKQYEGRPATVLQERVEESDKFADVLQVVRFVNKTDVQTLAHTFGTLRRIANASMEELSLCPGLGARKVQKLHAAFTDPLDPVVGRKKQKNAEISPFLTRPQQPDDALVDVSSEL